MHGASPSYGILPLDDGSEVVLMGGYETRHPSECKSLAGADTMTMGVPLDWKVVREKRIERA